MLDRRLIIGLGCGRCGTTSLSVLLTQKDAFITHEQRQMTWCFSHFDLQANLQLFKQRPENIVGDVAFWWLNYVPAVNAKFICLKRDKQDTVNSFMKWFKDKDYWTDKATGKDRFEEKDGYGIVYRTLNTSFPTIPNVNKRKAISIYYNIYYQIAERFERNLPNFKIFDMKKTLGTEQGQKELFKYLNLPNHETKMIHESKS